MAGTIIADYIRTDANKLSLNVGNTVVASINASGILSNTGSVLIAPNGAIVADNIQTGNLNASLLTTGTLPKARLPSGSVLQIVQTTVTPGGGTAVSSTAGSTTVMSLAITPQSTSSKILVCVSVHLEIGASGTSAGSLSMGERILRNSTEVYASGEKWFVGNTTQTFEAWYTQYLDSPSTTSAITYNYQITPAANRGDVRFGRNGTTVMQLIEIAG
jgi:hypothetical protein